MSDAPQSQNPAPSAGPLPGRIGRYVILQPIGKGAMGVVYLAQDTVLERDVALKVMVPQIADDAELNERFRREAKAVAKMTHPNVVAVFDLGQHADGSPYIAMELLKGQDLQKAMRGQPPLPLERKISIMIQVLAGLAHAHAAGIVHRDIKPANIFLNQDGAAKIMDFGVARLTTGSMTGTGNIVGTADYMSPEQVQGAKVDGRSDLFSVGCMLYELLAGKRPFHAESLMAIFYKITHEEPNWDLIPGGDEYDSLLPILQRALSKDLEQRYQSAYEFAVELRNYLVSHVTNTTGAHALENLLEGERASPPSMDFGAVSPTLNTLADLAPTNPADRAGVTHPRAASPRTATSGAATLRGAKPTTLDPLPGARTQAPGPGTILTRGEPPQRAPQRPFPQRRAAPPAPSRGPVLGGLAALLLAAAGGGYWWMNRPQPVAPTPAPPPSLAPTPAPTTPTAAPTIAPSAATVVVPPPTAAPPPTFGETQGKSAAAMAAAQAAFRKNDYGRALEQAQAALRDEPQNANAQKLLEQALAGQKAQGHLANAESALQTGDLERAEAEAEQARTAAPWDGGVTGLYGRINEARTRAAQQAQQLAGARVGQLLNEAEAAVGAQKYDEALKAYEEALKLDPQNVVARSGKTSVIAARNAGPARPSGHTFAAEKTVASAGKANTGNLPPGFVPEDALKVQKGTQAVDLPGRIQFEVSPEGVKPGDKFSVRISLLNEGTAPIQVASLMVNTSINGKSSGGPIAPRAKDVGPGLKALLHEVNDLWKEDYASWSMAVTITTARGEKYTNKLGSK